MTNEHAAEQIARELGQNPNDKGTTRLSAALAESPPATDYDRLIPEIIADRMKWPGVCSVNFTRTWSSDPYRRSKWQCVVVTEIGTRINAGLGKGDDPSHALRAAYKDACNPSDDDARPPLVKLGPGGDSTRTIGEDRGEA